jgi:site-specific recombinase XerD
MCLVAELFGDLNKALNQYLLGGYRDKLLKGADKGERYVFISTRQTKFESSAFSHHLSALLHRLTGCKTTSNILRSSFVVNLMETGQSEKVRSSAARCDIHYSMNECF